MIIKWLRPDEVDIYWHELEPEFKRVVDKAVHGEFLVSDIRKMALDGHATIGIIRDGDEIVMAVAFEFRHYPQKMGVNVFAMGGKRMFEVLGKFFESFKEFCRVAGADWIECSVSPGMERLHHRSGYKTIYRHLRFDLQEVKK